MINTKRLITGSLILTPHFLLAQSSITGAVRYKEDHSPAAYVNISLAGTDRKVVCDEKGQFSFTGVKPGEYQLLVTYFEHDTLKQQVVLKDGELLNTELLLSQPRWVKDIKQAQVEKARQDSLENANRKYRAKRHRPKY